MQNSIQNLNKSLFFNMIQFSLKFITKTSNKLPLRDASFLFTFICFFKFILKTPNSTFKVYNSSKSSKLDNFFVKKIFLTLSGCIT